MKFGAVPVHQLSSLDLSLPKEPFINTLVLPGIRAADPKVYIGAASWGNASWNGKVFPPKTPATRYRQLYPKFFGAMELNATHYRIYDAETLRQWNSGAKGRSFRFCPKFPQEISHYSHFRDAGQSTAAFLQGIRAFEENLGPAFLQLGEHYGPADRDALFHYLATLPTDLSFFVELRHPQWFSDDKIREETFEVLRTLNIGAVITDTPGRRDVVHMQLTLPKVLLRFVCNGTHPSSLQRTDDWVRQLQHWIDSGLEEAYVFLHPGEEAAVPELASYWTRSINRHCSLELPDPTASQKGLFDL